MKMHQWAISTQSEKQMIHTIEFITGLYLGEGHFTITKNKTKGDKWQFRAEVGFSNSDPALIDAVCEWQESLGIHHHIRQNSQGCYQLIVHHYGDILKIIETLEPHLCGNKKPEASLVKRFVLHRLRPKEKLGKKLGNNQFNPITQEDHDLVEQKRILRESSETKSIPVCCEQHGYSTSEYQPYQNVKFDEDTKRWTAPN